MVLPELADARAWTDSDVPCLLDLAADLPCNFAVVVGP